MRGDGIARVWDSNNGEPVSPRMKGRVYDARFSVNGRRIFTWSPEGAHLWSSNSDQVVLVPLIKAIGEDTLGSELSQDETHVWVWGSDTVQVRRVGIMESWPKDELNLLVEVQTNTWLDKFGELQNLSVDEWEKRKCRYDQIREELKLKDSQEQKTWEYSCNAASSSPHE